MSMLPNVDNSKRRKYKVSLVGAIRKYSLHNV
jgi:hypothetical protein